MSVMKPLNMDIDLVKTLFNKFLTCIFLSPIYNMKVLMPEASKSNVHGCIHGKSAVHYCNAGGVEEYLNKQILFFKFYIIFF